jgi:fluoride exporter
MHPLIPVMTGGAFGAGLRYSTGMLFIARGSNWPWGTFCVNILGGFAMGVLAAFVFKGGVSETIRLFAGVGILGGFTTFSAFSLESFQMIGRGQAGMAGLYALASVIGSIAALAVGYWMTSA